MRRGATEIALLAMIAAGAVTVGELGARTTHRQATTITIWVGWSAGHELKEFKKVVAEYDQKHPDVDVKVVGGINDDKILAALRGGQRPRRRAARSVVERRHLLPVGRLDRSRAAASRATTSTSTSSRRPPVLHAVQGQALRAAAARRRYGLYYNTALFKKAGLTGPPKTSRS